MNADERRSEERNSQEEKRLWDAVLILAGLIFCEKCSKEGCPEAPVFTDEQYAAVAHRLWSEGWRATEQVKVYCPQCLSKQALR